MIIKEVKFESEEYQKTITLRDKLLRKPLGLEFTEEQLAEEFDSYHLAAIDEEDEIVACLVLKPVNAQEIKMRQVAVREESQGKGLGKLIIQFAEVFAKDQGFESIIVHAREVALPFYLNLNYKQEGDRFEEVGIPHFKVYKKISE